MAISITTITKAPIVLAPITSAVLACPESWSLDSNLALKIKLKSEPWSKINLQSRNKCPECGLFHKVDMNRSIFENRGICKLSISAAHKKSFLVKTRAEIQICCNSYEKPYHNCNKTLCSVEKLDPKQIKTRLFRPKPNKMKPITVTSNSVRILSQISKF